MKSARRSMSLSGISLRILKTPEWAQRKGIRNSDSCSGNSNSFIKGCRDWAEEQQGGWGSDSADYNEEDPGDSD